MINLRILFSRFLLRKGWLFVLVSIAALQAWQCTQRPELQVGTSGDYAPFSTGSWDGDGSLQGFDIDIAKRFAADHGREAAFQRFRWPELVSDLVEGRFEIAMSGITVRPERSLAGLFTTPVAVSGAVALVPQDSALGTTHDLNSKGVRIGVNAGGHLEKTARAFFPQASIGAIPDNAAVLATLSAGESDAVITDSLEAPHWMAQASSLRAIGPFTADRKAYLIRPEFADSAAEFDAWLFEKETDGTLGALRRQHLSGTNHPETATPLYALFSAIDERLSLMPLIAETKRQQGLAVRDRSREKLVLDAASSSVRKAAQRLGAQPYPEDRIRTLFRALIEASVKIQLHTLAQPPGDENPPDLATVMRPAVLRLGERIARYIVLLRFPLDPSSVRAVAAENLRSPGIGQEDRDAIIEAVLALRTSGKTK